MEAIQLKLKDAIKIKYFSYYQFNLWLNGDCGGTDYEKNYRAWFYFKVKTTNKFC